jgi:hypothetical protein
MKKYILLTSKAIGYLILFTYFTQKGFAQNNSGAIENMNITVDDCKWDLASPSISTEAPSIHLKIISKKRKIIQIDKIFILRKILTQVKESRHMI